eukprot:TRINITY_DN21352_c1_g1_i1.p1 TRINITY_DN21352_c1_g1~~TRINITY_DN21352_c1_g1_i1.p1  ORF type:complete len:128 (-),score=6.55 TRINITY_DN21352_c1_g1_i1:71-454(-)
MGGIGWRKNGLFEKGMPTLHLFQTALNITFCFASCFLGQQVLQGKKGCPDIQLALVAKIRRDGEKGQAALYRLTNKHQAMTQTCGQALHVPLRGNLNSLGVRESAFQQKKTIKKKSQNQKPKNKKNK